MGFRTGLLLVLILATGCAAPLVLDEDNATVVIPRELGSEGHIIVRAMINGRGPFRFALDTGASISVVFDSTRRRAGIELTEGENVGIQGMVSSGTFPLTTIAELRIGGESWNNARVASMPTEGGAFARIDGILGIDFLRRFAVGVSASDQVVRLYPPQLVSERSYRGWTSIPMKPLQVGKGGATVFTISLHINDIEIPAMLDLGTGSNLMNWHTANTIQVSPRRARQGTELSGAVETVPVVAELKVKQLRIGTVSWRNRIFLISDFPIFEALGLEDRLAAILGPSMFNERDFVIDFARERMLIGARK
jgi:predicted aspartyl protease